MFTEVESRNKQLGFKILIYIIHINKLKAKCLLQVKYTYEPAMHLMRNWVFTTEILINKNKHDSDR